jgi:hypothetical protein
MDVLVALNAKTLIFGVENKHLFLVLHVTVGTGRLQMFSGERKTGFIVIKIRSRFHHLPTVGHMAIRARLRQQLLAELADVDIGVTSPAGLFLQLIPMILAEFFLHLRSRHGQHELRLPGGGLRQVAIGALTLAVLAVDDKASVGVVFKVMDGFPLLLIVAVETAIHIHVHGRLKDTEQMEVFVTRQTIASQTGVVRTG